MPKRIVVIKHSVIGVCLMLTMLSCGPRPPVDINRRPMAVSAKEYPRQFKDWSRDIRVIPFNGLENVLTARVTYLSYTFREAYIAAVAADLNASPADQDKIRTDKMAGVDTGHQFFVTLMSAVKNFDDLDPKEGPWTIRLRNDQGKETTPSSVEEIEHPTAAHEKYFAFQSTYRKAYRITFPFAAADGSPIIGDSAHAFEITFASPYGRGTAKWEIEGR